MPTRHIIPTGAIALTGSVTLMTATEVTAGTSSAIFASSASNERISFESGASSAIFTSSATTDRSVDEVAASSAIASSDATATFVAYVGEEDPNVVIIGGGGTYEGEELEVWSINAATKAAGKYTNFNFNSFARIGNKLYGIGDLGIFEIGGDTDAGQPIGVFLQSGTIREDTGKILPQKAYLVGEIPDGVLDKLDFFIIDDDDERYDYAIDMTDGRLDSVPVHLGRGIKTRHLRYGIYGSITAPLELSSVTIATGSSPRNA